MWVFGYGSLMWDGWEKCHSCTRTAKATLNGFRRDFNKASVENWGSKKNPAPTLNLVQDQSINCEGIVFEFAEGQRQEVLDYLQRREGKNFELKELCVTLENGETNMAIVPVYSGTNIISDKTLSERAEMAKKAVGQKGNCIDYIKNIAERLDDLGIRDKAVEEFQSHVL